MFHTTLFDLENLKPKFRGWNKQIVYCFSDTDESWLLRVVDGRPEPLVQQEVDEPDVRFTMTIDTPVGLMNGSIFDQWDESVPERPGQSQSLDGRYCHAADVGLTRIFLQHS